MSSFFTLPASQKKRKRAQPSEKQNSPAKRARKDDNDSISGSDLSDDDSPAQVDDFSGSEDEGEEFENEDPAAKRIRLAEQYLANTQKEVLDDVGFDAAEVDQENLRRRMGERLKEDTAETKGKLYRWIADDLDWRRADKRALRFHGPGKSWTGVDVHGRYIYATAYMDIVKWEIPEKDQDTSDRRYRKNPKIVARTRGNRKDKRAQHHDKAILCLAVSPDGKFVATGGQDKKLIIWDSSLKPLKVFTQHRDAVTALTFRRGTNQLFSASKDRTVKIWSLDELAYVETLFGHQDSVVDVGALTQEKCITVGSRDRTARLWKVVEESQLVFRGGGAPHRPKNLDTLKAAYEDDSAIDMNDESDPSQYHEGSIDRIALIDDDTFITASDNGSLSLWNIHKKKPVSVYPLAHGLDPVLSIGEASADIEPDENTFVEKSRGGKQPRWITAMKSIPFSDVFVTGSWDGYVRAWRISQDKRRIEPLGAAGKFVDQPATVDALLASEGLSAESLSSSALAALKEGIENHAPAACPRDVEIKGVINDIAIVDRGERGKDGVLIVAAVGKEHRLGRWREFEDGRCQVVMLQVPRQLADAGDEQQEIPNGVDKDVEEDDFDGFD